MAAFDLVKVKRLPGSGAAIDAPAADRQPRIFQREIDVFAPETRHFGSDDIAVLGLIHVNRRRP